MLAGVLLGLLILVNLVQDPVLDRLGLDLLVGETGQLVGGTHVAHLFDIPLGEDQVDLFQAATGGFGVEEPDDGDEDSVPGSKEQVGTPANTVNHHRGDHDDSKVEQPVVAGRNSIGLGSGLEGRKFGGIEPGEREPGGTKDTHVEEEAKDGTLGTLCVTRNETGEDDDHGDALTDRATEEQLATTDLLNEEPGECGENGVTDHVDTTNQKREIVRLVQGVFEQDRQIVDDSVAARQLLEDLRRGANNHAAEVLRATASEQVGEFGFFGTGTDIVSIRQRWPGSELTL